MKTNHDKTKTQEDWATPKQVAEYFNVTTQTIFNWFKQGIIPAGISVERVYRFQIAEVEKALVKRSQQVLNRKLND